MKKKLDTRFPAARIKKIMQADEDVGKIAMAVPLLVSKALELFLQDLCDQTYDITSKKVSKVPDLGGSDAADEDHSVCKRSGKVVDDDNSDSDNKPKRSRVDATSNNKRSRNGRGRGRVRDHGWITRGSLMSRESVQANNSLRASVRNFDLNVGLDENGDSVIPVAARPCPIKKTIPEFKHEEYPGWPFSEIDKMGIDPTQLADFSRRIDEEDYDE
ncbi:hypothetical protein SLE2022_352330 [Rubroshorea leprosula]